jgi:hypothetical protein
MSSSYFDPGVPQYGTSPTSPTNPLTNPGTNAWSMQTPNPYGASNDDAELYGNTAGGFAGTRNWLLGDASAAGAEGAPALNYAQPNAYLVQSQGGAAAQAALAGQQAQAATGAGMGASDYGYQGALSGNVAAAQGAAGAGGPLAQRAAMAGLGAANQGAGQSYGAAKAGEMQGAQGALTGTLGSWGAQDVQGAQQASQMGQFGSTLQEQQNAQNQRLQQGYAGDVLGLQGTELNSQNQQQAMGTNYQLLQDQFAQNYQSALTGDIVGAGTAAAAAALAA